MTRTQFLLRGSAALGGAVGLTGGVVILSSVESRSILVLAAVAVSSLTGVAFLTLAFSRESVWRLLSSLVQRLLASPGESYESKRVGLVLIVVGLVAYVAQIVVLFPQNDSFAGEDEEAYLITAQEIAAFGGTTGLVRSLYSGEFSEANRHPLYLWLLSGSPEFGAGKFVSSLLGLWTMGMVLGLCLQRQLGWIQTGIVCVGLGLNSAWGRFSITIGCEVLLVGLVGCVWFQFYGKPFRLDQRTNDSSTQWKHHNEFLIAGVAVLLALAWLAKGTGLLLTISLVAWLTLRRLPFIRSSEDRPLSPSNEGGTGQRTASLLRELLIFAAVWVAVASPLLVRNVVRFGSPFYNVNSWLLFVDEYSDPVALSRASTIGDAAKGYLMSHSVGDLLERGATGLFWETYILVRSLGPPPLDDARVIPGGIIALLAVLGWLVSRGEEKWLLLIWLAICMPMFAWYVPVAAGERFVLPLLVPILCYASEGTVHLVGKIASSEG